MYRQRKGESIMVSESSFLHGETNIDLPSSVGFFSWNVPENMVYGDEIFAFIYGLQRASWRLARRSRKRRQY